MGQFTEFTNYADIVYDESLGVAVSPIGKVNFNKKEKTLTFEYEDGRIEQEKGSNLTQLRNKIKERIETEAFPDGHNYSLVKVGLLITYADHNYLYKTGYMDGR